MDNIALEKPGTHPKFLMQSPKSPTYWAGDTGKRTKSTVVARVLIDEMEYNKLSFSYSAKWELGSLAYMFQVVLFPRSRVSPIFRKTAMC